LSNHLLVGVKQIKQKTKLQHIIFITKFSGQLYKIFSTSK